MEKKAKIWNLAENINSSDKKQFEYFKDSYLFQYFIDFLFKKNIEDKLDARVSEMSW